MTESGPHKKLERRVEKARSGWRLLREQFKELRRVPGEGFILFTYSHQEAGRWFFELLKFGVYSPDLEKLCAIDGVEQAESDEELAERNYAFGQFRLWARVAKAGMDAAKGEWAKQQRSDGEMDSWLEAAYATLDTKLFDVMTKALIEALADNQGYVMANIPKEPEGEQANFNLAALMREEIPLRGQAGGRLVRALSGEGGGREQWERTLLHMIPALTFLAWHDKQRAGGVFDLRKRVVNLLADTVKDDRNRERTRRIDPTLRLSQHHGEGHASHHPYTESSELAEAQLAGPRDELPEAELFEAFEAVRLQLNGLIKQCGLSQREAEVAVLRYEGKTTHDIAAIMGIKEETVRAYQFRIRGKVRRAS
jgi:RNA polymerase sigma factor (sigma-70 family)